MKSIPYLRTRASFATVSKFLVPIALMGASLSHGAVTMSSTTPVSFFSPPGDNLSAPVTDVFIDVDNDGTDDLYAFFATQGFLIVQGLGTSELAGVTGSPNFVVDAYTEEAGFTIGPGSTFGGNENAATNALKTATFAIDSTLHGNWPGGGEAIFGFAFERDSAIHYGYGTLNYDPTATALTSSAVFSDFVYESLAGTAITVEPVPEPTSLFLLSLGSLGLFARRRK